MAYCVTYRERDTTTEADHNAVMQLPTEDVTLEDVIDACQTFHVDALLYDEAGVSKGWVHSDGRYQLS